VLAHYRAGNQSGCDPLSPILEKWLLIPMAEPSPQAIPQMRPRPVVDDRTFEIFAGFLKRTSGFSLSPEKRYLIDTRLSTVAADLKLPALNALADIIAAGGNQNAERAVVEAMTTNETLFFRDTKPFEALRLELIPAIAKRRQDRRLRILCAAASTGQEPYSVAMALREAGKALESWTIDIVATDIDASVLERAKTGRYSQFEIQRGVPTPLLLKYFTAEPPRNWRIVESVRNLVRFQTLNLLDDLSSLGVFDIIFCRNVLLYFDVATKVNVLKRLMRQLTPDGYLFLGCAETIIGLCDGLAAQPAARGLYQRV
jgi:chemotaxis protein methyltransferase CheR